ncbi:DinB family protein [Empedobacter stercoris]|uniref:DinB family protein n=1 Tax=Empedobacter stercoris TaxID=1628248 RepID=UPI0021AEE173|nr:DinB family protein [Empedobacter stercoris]UWX67278.1 DinB family protein [Empedobacter stercoris]
MNTINHDNYINIYDGIEVVDALQTRIADIKKTLTIVTELNKWDYAYAEEKWTIKEMIQHCIDCERIFSYRAQHIAREDAQTLNFFDENAYVLTSNAKSRKPEELIKEWTNLMKATYFQFKSFDDETLNRIGKVGDREFSVEKIGFVMAGHSIHHMNVINERYL